LAAILAGATDSQIGALGEETAAVLLEDHRDATVVTMGDAGLPRTLGRQDLDLVVVIDEELVVYEVKTCFHSANAGRLTKAGNLRRPRLRRAPTPRGDRQGSQPYVAARLGDVVDTTNGYPGVHVQVMAVDFQAMLAQEFTVTATSGRLMPSGPPISCHAAAQTALQRILDHRGYL
jgi:hypothetical protein